MWNVHILGIDLIDVFYNFFIYAFLGWIYESSYVSIKNRAWVNRGFLNGPIIPIYGAGATVIYIVFWQYREDYILIFVGGMVLATLLEYLTSALMELLFHAKWWDYSNIKFNFHGRICLSVSFFWGFLSLAMIELIQPNIVNVFSYIHPVYGKYFAYAIFVAFSFDLALTVVDTLQLSKMLGELQKLKLEFYEYIDSTKLYETKEEWKHKLSNYKLTELVDTIKVFVEENKEKLIERNSRDGFEIKKYHLDIEKHVKDYLNKFQLRTNRMSHVQKRLLNAFPKMQFTRSEDVLKDLRERLQIHKKK